MVSTTAQEIAEMIDSLTARQRQVVILIGGRRQSYKSAAKQLEHLRSEGERSISSHTVREYARDLRDLMGSDLPPRDALTELYWSFREAFETA